MSVYFQILCTMLINTLGINMGIIFAWPASTIKLFASANTTLDRPMTETEVSLFGSLSCIGALISTPAAGYMLDNLGRRYSAIVSALGVVISWTIILSADRVEMILTGIFASGISSAIVLIASVYISEICQESIRGAMTAGNMVSYGVGVLLSYLLGGCLEYRAMLYVALTMSVCGVLVLFLLKETPVYLMSKGREEEAAKSISFYRRLKSDSKQIIEEINQIRRSLNPDLDDSLPEEQTLKPDLKPKAKLSFWQFLKKSRSTRQALFVNLVVLTAAIFQGLIVLQIYAEKLFEEAIPGASPTLCSVLLAAFIVISGLVAAYLTERAGRRPLMIYASLGLGVCCVILGTQIHLHWGPNWLTAVFMYLFPILYTCGAGTVPFVLLAELFLPEVKSFSSMILVEWSWFCSFIILFIFNPLLNLIGLGPVFYIFAAICFFTSIFCIFFLPETKGLTVDAIQMLFTKKKTPSVY